MGLGLRLRYLRGVGRKAVGSRVYGLPDPADGTAAPWSREKPWGSQAIEHLPVPTLWLLRGPEEVIRQCGKWLGNVKRPQQRALCG